jgi:biopolymer transport protein ExbB/TolQ
VESVSEAPLSWSRLDIEQRLGFRGGRYTQTRLLLSGLIGAALTVAFYAALIPLGDTRFAGVAEMFTNNGIGQYATCFLTAWSLSILALKGSKLRLQRRTLGFNVVPSDYDFVLSSGNVDQVTGRIYATVDDPKQFLLFNRIMIALSNLRNLGRVSDVGDILRAQAESDESSMYSSYSMVEGFVWAIPVLGFIGTVLGLSAAIGGFSNVIAQAADISQLADALKGVTAGLSKAFQTTLVALVAALAVQLLLTYLKKSEEDFLDACAEYCTRHVVSKLRIMPFEQEPERTTP